MASAAGRHSSRGNAPSRTASHGSSSSTKTPSYFCARYRAISYANATPIVPPIENPSSIPTTVRHASRNGSAAAGASRDSRAGDLLVHELRRAPDVDDHRTCAWIAVVSDLQVVGDAQVLQGWRDLREKDRRRCHRAQMMSRERAITADDPICRGHSQDLLTGLDLARSR